MIRNIPTDFTADLLLALLDSQGFQNSYDFVYLPIDFRHGVSLGYAFVNATSHHDALRIFGQLQGYSASASEGHAGYEVTWTHPNQGLQQHVERYRNSPVMHPSMPDDYKPRIFVNGIRAAFPPPTKPIKAPKIRQAKNATQNDDASAH